MKKYRIALPAADAKAHPRSAVDDPALLELLDHLGGLIAREYVALLRKNRPTRADPPRERER